MFNDKLVVSFKGNITRLESKKLPSGVIVTNVGLAFNERFRDKNSRQIIEKVTYINGSAYGKTAELLITWAKTGSCIFLDNQPLKAGSKPGMFEILIQDFDILKNGRSKEEVQQSQPSSGFQQAPQHNQALQQLLQTKAPKTTPLKGHGYQKSQYQSLSHQQQVSHP